MQVFSDGAARLGFKLTDLQNEQFETYYREMVDWNRRVNLTAITTYKDVQTKHFLDSLTVTIAINQPEPGNELKVIDVGTGAGLPGIPLKIVLPGIRLTLLEATRKKTIFLEHVKNTLQLVAVEVVSGRAEDVARLASHRGRYDLVLSRAVAALPVLLELTLPFCKPGGIFVAQKQIEAKPEIDEASRAAQLLGGKLREVLDVDLPEFKERRCLVVYDKVSPTPAEYPRRPGVPAKKPL